MAEEQSGAQERNELPTQKRRDKARDEGQIPRSPEIVAAFGLLAAASALAVSGGSSIGGGAAETLREAFGRLTAEPLTIGAADGLIRNMVFAMLKAVAPVAAAVFGVIVLVGAIQGRGVLSAKPMAPDFSRVSPMAGLKRLFSAQSLFNLLKSILKLGVLGTLTWAALHKGWADLSGLGGEGSAVTLGVIRDMAIHLVTLVGLGFMAIAGLDYVFQVFQHEKQLKMTRQEIVQEHRESEGDPQVKSRMQSLARAMARKRMLHRVKEADVVVVNPVHVAVALKYEFGQDGAPMVLAMGKRKLALKIKELAKKANVPVVENPPLARALIATATVGKAIPPALYAAVAEVLAWVYKRRGGNVRGLVAKARA